MKITIESTSKVVVLVDPLSRGTIPARIWEGHTDSGIPVHCYITRIAVHKDADQTQFERELDEQRDPSVDVAGIPPRLLI